MNKLKKQRGVALLFALGILSLILVTGLAFLGNALISQKIAFNSQESNAARLLARNAADRAIAHLAMFHITQAKNHAQYYVSDASSVFSRISKNPVETAETSVKTTESEERAISQDQLSDAKTSRLNAGVFELGNPVQRFPWYKGNSSRAKWIYIHSDGKESAGNGKDVAGNNMETPIIGRYAYQVLPATSTSRISLYAVTKGSYRNLHPAVDTPATSNHKVAKQYRWGIDVDELLIDDPLFKDWGPAEDSTPLSVDNDDLSQREFDTFFNIHSGKEGSLYLADDAADNKKKDVELKKRWVKNIFSEGTGRLTRETYPDNSSIPYGGLRVWYPRFNLSDFKPYESANKKEGTWYSRFVIDPKKEADEVAALLNGKKLPDDKTVLDYLAGDSPVIYRDSNVKDCDYDKPIGLPFLRRIGSDTEKGAFEKVEYLRKQIAANLNDYCDADSIPTSNIPAQDWASKVEKSDAADLPAYTGNEKTHYINEIALGVQLTDAKFDNSGKFVGKVDAEVLAELIRIYDSVPDISKYKLHGYFKHLALTFSVTFKGSVKVEYTNNADSTPGSSTVNIDEELSKESAVKFDPARLEGFDISWSEPDKVVENGSYWVSNWQSPSTDEQRSPLNIDFSEEIKKKVDLTGKTVTGITVDPSNVTVKLLKVEYNITNLALMINDAAATPTDYGVDFVKLSAPSRGDGHEISIPEDKQKLELFDATTPGVKKGIIHIGIMQAIDPRQNLNAIIKNSDNKTSDWYITAEPTISFVADKSKWDWKQLKTRVSAGNVNFCSNPNVPKYADGTEIASTNRDKEETPDPAWRGEGKDKHISTAVIRNAPMRSPWELGFIHRGIPFQTINLKSAGGIDDGENLASDAHKADNFVNWDSLKGTIYQYGDAGIFDQIKMTEYNKSYGKVDFSVLRDDSPSWAMGSSVESFNKSLFKSLFQKLERHDSAQKFIDRSKAIDSATGYQSGKDIANPIDDNFWDEFEKINSMRRSSLLDFSKKSLIADKLTVGDNDAMQEELIGRSINLMEGATVSLPNVFQIVVVAQTIRDLSGDIIRQDYDSQIRKSSDEMEDAKKGLGRQAELGRFDAYIGSNLASSIYYDEILSECRMLVTVEKIHYMETVGTGKVPRARLRVKQIEYLD